MGRFRALHNLRSDDDGDNRRKGGRVLIDALANSDGIIQDLSSSGAKFTTTNKWTVGDVREITVGLDTDHPLKVKARCAWVAKAGWRSRNVGVEFIDLTEAEKRRLAQLANCSAKRGWGPKRQSNDVDWERLEEQAARDGNASHTDTPAPRGPQASGPRNEAA